MSKTIKIHGIIGKSGDREVFIGITTANILHSLSFADVLNEETGNGYQRRFNPHHSLDFRRYIQTPNSTTIPLTLNLRPSYNNSWKIKTLTTGTSQLIIQKEAGKLFAQVDCQHRISHLSDLEISLPFMTFLGLDIREEMEIFSIINSKAKGLSTSLLDYHESRLISDLAVEKPELYVALYLNDHTESPWYKQLDLGGERTSGIIRKASLRTMQKAVKRFLFQTNILSDTGPETVAKLISDFWSAIAGLLANEWANPRKHFLTKGIGVYSLMSLAADLYQESHIQKEQYDINYFSGVLSDFIYFIDWSSSGHFVGLGGESGVQQALEIIRMTRHKSKLKMVSHG